MYKWSAIFILLSIMTFFLGVQLSAGDTDAKLLTEERPATTLPEKPPVAPSVSTIPLSEIIANQILTQNTMCPAEDKVTYEACLLFQSALGTWLRRGLSETCKPWGSEAPQPITPEIVRDAINKPCFLYLYAIHVANVTPILVSTSKRIFHTNIEPNFTRPSSDPEQCLLKRHGICGNHAAVALALLKRAGLTTRDIQFYYKNKERNWRENHITAEVFIDGRWRLIDTTYGAYWSDPNLKRPLELMATDDLMQAYPSTIFYNTALMPYSYYYPLSKKQQVLFSYLRSQPAMIRGGVGQIPLNLRKGAGKENFQDIPNYVGDNQYNDQFEGITYQLLTKKKRTYQVDVNVSGSAFSKPDKVLLCIDQSCQPFSKDQMSYSYSVKSPSELYLETEMDVAYVVLESLEWKEVGGTM